VTTRRATYRWDGGFEAMRHLNGQTVDVLRPLRVPEEADAEVGPMFLVRFPEGNEEHAYVDELVWQDVLYEKCRLCHLFIAPNEPENPEVADYVHLTRGDAADELLETHPATPSGFKATLDTWKVFGPTAMRERFFNTDGVDW
jgi:hypothetical protein